MGLKNPERERFLLAFGYLFHCTSPTMGVKCWKNVAKDLPDHARFALIESLWAIAKIRAENCGDAPAPSRAGEGADR